MHRTCGFASHNGHSVFSLTTFCTPPYKSSNVKPLFSANIKERKVFIFLCKEIIWKKKSETHILLKYSLNC